MWISISHACNHLPAFACSLYAVATISMLRPDLLRVEISSACQLRVIPVQSWWPHDQSPMGASSTSTPTSTSAEATQEVAEPEAEGVGEDDRRRRCWKCPEMKIKFSWFEIGFEPGMGQLEARTLPLRYSPNHYLLDLRRSQPFIRSLLIWQDL